MAKSIAASRTKKYNHL